MWGGHLKAGCFGACITYYLLLLLGWHPVIECFLVLARTNQTKDPRGGTQSPTQNKPFMHESGWQFVNTPVVAHSIAGHFDILGSLCSVGLFVERGARLGHFDLLGLLCCVGLFVWGITLKLPRRVEPGHAPTSVPLV